MKRVFVLCAFVPTALACSDDTVIGPDGGPPKTDATIDQVAPSDATAEAEAEAAPPTCLTSSGADSYFAIADTTKCVVAAYTVSTTSLPTFTWGRNGGPVTFSAGSSLDVVRYTLPASPTGALVPTSTPVTPTNVPNDAFWSPEALDIPFFASLKWTAISYTGSTSPFAGEVIIVDDTGAVAVRYDVNGFYSTASVAATDDGRLLYTALSPISTTTSSTNVGALYAADSCGTTAQNPRLVPSGDVSCMAPFQLATWQGGTSGPVTVDNAGNAFAILSTIGANEELRGFASSNVARGQAATAGTTLATDPNFTSTLVADGTTAYYQPNDGTTYAPLDVQAVGYTVNGGTLSINGQPQAALTLVTPGTALSLLVDGQKQLWVGVQNPGVGDAGSTTATFFVIAPKP